MGDWPHQFIPESRQTIVLNDTCSPDQRQMNPFIPCITSSADTCDMERQARVCVQASSETFSSLLRTHTLWREFISKPFVALCFSAHVVLPPEWNRAQIKNSPITSLVTVNTEPETEAQDSGLWSYFVNESVGGHRAKYRTQRIKTCLACSAWLSPTCRWETKTEKSGAWIRHQKVVTRN